MEGREDGHAIQQNQVLIRRASAHIERRRKIGGRNHARQDLDGADRISLGDPGDELQVRHRHLADGHARNLLKANGFARAICLDANPPKLNGHLLDHEIARGHLSVLQSDGNVHRHETDSEDADPQCDSSGPREREASLGVGERG